MRQHDADRDVPSTPVIHQFIEAQAARTPDATAVTLDGWSLSYDALNRRANALARRLRAAGVGPEVPVALLMERSLDAITGMLAILKAGGGYVPIDPLYPAERLDYILTDTGAPVILTQQHLISRIPAPAGQPLHVISADAEPDGGPEEDDDLPNIAAQDNLAYVIYTSGSTGKPKGVAVTHEAAVGHFTTIHRLWNLRETDRVLAFASFTFDASVEQIFPTLFSGATLVLRGMEGWSAVEFTRRASELRLTVADLPTAYWDQWVQEYTGGRHVESGRYDLSALRLIVIGGEAVRTSSVHRWQRSSLRRIRLVNGYGPTETTVTASIYEIPSNPPRGEALPERIPIGRPLPGRTMYILDEQRNPVPEGAAGELYIGGSGVARGYLNRPELTAERFVPDPFDRQPTSRLYRTGDLARFLPDGTVEFLGRVDRQVKVRGFRIELGEIEERLSRHLAVREAAVVLREDVPGDKRLAAYLTTKWEVTPRELRSFLQQTLPAYMLPSAYVSMESLPVTSHGKIDYGALPVPDGAPWDLGGNSAPPRNRVEETLAAVWKDILRVDDVGIHDSFTDLGGDSLLAVTMMAAAADAGLDFTPSQFLRCSTIAELAAVTRLADRRQPPAPTGDEPSPTSAPLTPPLLRYAQAPHRLSANGVEAIACEIEEGLEPNALADALRHVVQHHDALRLHLVRDESGWRTAVTDGAPIRLHQIDVSGRAPAEQQATITARLEDLQADIDPFSGSPIRAAYVTGRAGAPDLLVLLVHHIAVDAYSEGIIVQDLETVYRQLVSGESAHLPRKTTSFTRWSARLAGYAASEELRRELIYWRTMRWDLAPRLPARDESGEGHTSGSGAIGHIDHVDVELDSDETALLMHSLPPSEARPGSAASFNDLLVTALAQSFGLWTGTDRLLLRIITHGRDPIFDDVDLSRTVGWLTSAFPVLLDVGGASRPMQAVRAVAAQLRQVPAHGQGYGLLRHISDDAGVREQMSAIPTPQVHLNFLGRVTPGTERSMFRQANHALAPEHRRAVEMTSDVRIKGYIEHGKLQLRLNYHENAYRREDIETVAAGIVTALRAMIEDRQRAVVLEVERRPVSIAASRHAVVAGVA
ncbi:MAG TPA: amino acid adenylation domain-containing protein [Chloroflexota bacterium]|nr:amino acid adenylation domain-containing protein [Chloroflexota bacterium]